ncbi:MAG: hypothetical protein ACEPOZ_04200 [Marinifilaceae bacterium]
MKVKIPLKKAVLAIVVCTLIVQNTYSTVKEEVKKVECSVEIMPNYLWHIFALSNLWNHDSSRYSDRYKNTIPKKDKDFMYEHRDLIAWGNGATGKYTVLLFFNPFSDEISYKEYCHYLDDLLKYGPQSKWKEFADKYSKEENNKQTISNCSFTKQDFEILTEITAIIKRNYPTFKKEIWKNTKQILEQEKLAIDAAFAGNDIIGLWENALQMKYSGDSFTPVLTYANALDYLPSANNLTDSRNNFGLSGKNTEYTIDLIVHEIGIFVLMPTILSIFKDPALQTEFNKKNSVVYQSFESLIEKKKGDIAGKRKTWEGKIFAGGKYDFPWFFNYYEKNGKGMEIEQLLRNAIAEYEKTHNNK